MIITATLKSTGQKISAELKEKKKCFCGRDFTIEEFMEIVKTLRKDENYDKEGKKTMFDQTQDILFACAKQDQKPLEQFSEEESSHQTVVRELNAMFNKYEINTCARKIHFLAQAYHETDRFRSPIEHRKLTDYGGFTGRGFLHLTGFLNYFKYYNHFVNYNYVKKGEKHIFDEKKSATIEGIISKNNLSDVLNIFKKVISTSLWFALDSAGWYWINGNKGDSGGVTPNYKDTNLIADEGISDAICKNVTKNINGGINGLEERQLYTKILKKVMSYENCKNKK